MRSDVKGHECNSCVTYRCSKIRSEYPKMRTNFHMSATELAYMNCPNYKCARPFRIPILMHLATDTSKVQSMNDLLTHFKFQMVEKKKFPYFRLLAKKGK